MFVLSVSMLFCLIVAVYYHEPFAPFVISSVLIFLLATAIFLMTKRSLKSGLQKKDAYLVVSLSWIILGFFGSLPYIFSETIPGFVNAFFESVSGFTTTGSSVLTDIESLPKSILFWRSLTHWIGGVGIIVLVIIILPGMKIGGYQLFSLESSLQEKIKPRIQSVGKRLFIVYVLLTVLEIVMLMFGGMNLFESVCHAFGTIATGGFSPKNDSLAGYSPYIQYVVMVFMLLAGTNFLVHIYLLKRNYKKAFRNEELKFYLIVIFIIGSIVTAILALNMHMPFEHAFREGFFQVISIITCTGFATADYQLWPVFAWMLLFFAMFLGGSTGSTAGGIKMARHLVLFKNIKRVFYKISSPHIVMPIRLNSKAITEKENVSILGFILLYLILVIAGSLVLSVSGLDGQTASSAVATAMAGIGPGIGSVGPVDNFFHLSSFAKLVLTFFMILGRLEIYTVLVLFTREFWVI